MMTAARTSFEVWNTGTVPVKIKDVKTDNQGFEYEGEKSFTLEPGEKIDGKAKAGFPTADPPSVEGSFQFLPEDENLDPLIISALWKAVGPQLVLDVEAPGGGVVGGTIFLGDGTPVRIIFANEPELGDFGEKPPISR